MQKTDTRASILIWAIFLSLIISVIFIWVSTKINKNLKNNADFSDKITINNEIKNIINNWKIDWNFINKYLSNWDKIIFEPSNNVWVWLKQWEIHLAKINDASNITITILEWSAIKYKNWTNEWIIQITWSFPVSIWDLEISNLWWYSKIQISSDVTTNYLSKYRDYYIMRDIWNKEIVKTKWKIKNF